MTEIVVGVDASATSVSALRWALTEARLRRIGVRAVLAWTGGGLPVALGPVRAPSGPGAPPPGARPRSRFPWQYGAHPST
ncbi:hypothetical protein [Frankia sp. EAN1pec]|uniref:hypothetical protein n=1 Tax=Parafrankia sp. (strain EAN1pec) TaxID=298653 RepID=UPI0002DC24CA